MVKLLSHFKRNSIGGLTKTNKAYLLLAKAIKAVSIICILQKVSGYTTGSKLLTVAASAVGVVFVEVGA